MSKLFDRFKRSRGGRGRSSVPSALLSNALRRASDERAAMRAASPAGVGAPVIDVETVEVSHIDAEVEAQERLAAAARERAEAEELALQAARLRAEAEERATELAKEREETERSATREAQDRAVAEREAASALEERLRIESGMFRPRPVTTYRKDPSVRSERENRRLRRALALALVALAVVGGLIYARATMPELFGEHATAPVFQLEHELKTPPANGK